MRRSLRIVVLPLIFALVTCVTLVNCGGGGGGGGGGSSNIITIDGKAMKGPLEFAVVSVYVLNADGTKGELLGTTSTSILGDISFVTVDETPTGFVLVEVTNGLYEDEATGIDVALIATDVLTVVFADELSAVNQVAVTPLTSMAAARARVLAAAGTPLKTAIDSCNINIGQQFGIDNISQAHPGNAADDDPDRIGSATRNRRLYGIVLAGIAEQAKTLGVSAIELSNALVQDCQNDGLFDGLDNGTEVSIQSDPVQTLSAAAATTNLQTAVTLFLLSSQNTTNLNAHTLSTSAIPIGVTSASALLITSTTLPSWTEGQSGTGTITITGGTPPITWAVTSGALPSWLTMTVNADGSVTFSGTAPLLAPGSTRSISPLFTLTATDSSIPPVSRSIQLAVDYVKSPPTVTPISIPAPEQNEDGYDQIPAECSGGTGPSYWTLEIGKGFPPSGIVLWPDGHLRGKATGTPGTTSTFGVCCVDLVGSFNCADITMTVDPGTTPTDDSDFDGTYDATVTTVTPLGTTSGQGTFTATNGNVSDPGGTFTGTVDANGNFTGTTIVCQGCDPLAMTGVFSTTSQFTISGSSGSVSQTIVATKR